MYKYTTNGYMAGMFAVLTIFCGQFSFAQAALISNEQVETQKKEVLLGIVSTLEEHVKILQMILIKKLEAIFKYLQTHDEKKKQKSRELTLWVFFFNTTKN